MLIIKDTREKQGWTFTPDKYCEGMLCKKLEEGDYTIQGYEDKIVIERKGALSEFAANLFQERFYREMDRLKKYPHSYILLEFEFSDIFGWPFNSLPRRQAEYSKISPYFLLKKISELQLKYNTKILFVGRFGPECAISLFKEIINLYETDNGPKAA